MNPHSLAGLLMRAWRQLSRRRRLQLQGLVVLMLVASVVEVFSIGAVIPFLGVLASPEDSFAHPLLAPLIRTFGITDSSALLLLVTILFAAGAVASGCVRYVLLTAQTRLTYAIGVDFSVGIFEVTLHQPYLTHVKRNSSEVLSGVSNKANDLIVSLLYPAAVAASSVVMLSVVLTVLMVLQPLVTVVTVAAFGTFYWVASALSRRRLDAAGRVVNRQYSAVIKLIQEGLGGIRDVLLDGTQHTFVSSYELCERQLRESRATLQILSGTPRYVVETLGIVFIAGLAYSLAAPGEGFGEAIPTLGVVALAAQRLIPVMQQLYASWVAIVGGAAAVGDALSFLEQPRGGLAVAPARQLSFDSHVRIHNVTFQYDTEAEPVLRGVNLIIPKGSVTGIIGETGSGKSTLLDLLMGLIRPTTGEIAVDGEPLTDEMIRAWQMNIGHVPQHIFLSDTTIAENIAFGQPSREVDWQRLIAAAKAAQIYEVIDALPKGFSTLVGERGVRFSGGQRQRLGVARALYKQCSVLILDEATSALDTETERAVMQAIAELYGTLTVVMVAHRYTSLSSCQAIIRLANGVAEVVPSAAMSSL